MKSLLSLLVLVSIAMSSIAYAQSSVDTAEDYNLTYVSNEFVDATIVSFWAAIFSNFTGSTLEVTSRIPTSMIINNLRNANVISAFQHSRMLSMAGRNISLLVILNTAQVRLTIGELSTLLISQLLVLQRSAGINLMRLSSVIMRRIPIVIGTAIVYSGARYFDDNIIAEELGSSIGDIVGDYIFEEHGCVIANGLEVLNIQINCESDDSRVERTTVRGFMSEQ